MRLGDFALFVGVECWFVVVVWVGWCLMLVSCFDALFAVRYCCFLAISLLMVVGCCGFVRCVLVVVCYSALGLLKVLVCSVIGSWCGLRVWCVILWGLGVLHSFGVLSLLVLGFASCVASGAMLCVGCGFVIGCGCDCVGPC